MASFDAAKKLILIKEIKSFLNLGLKESKDFVEKLPANLKDNVPMKEAEEIKEKFKELCVLEFE